MSTSNTITRCHNTTNCLLTYANQNRGQDFFNDVIIKTDSDQNISANRMVLSCYSKYFEKMFKSPMKEQDQRSIEVKDIDGKSLHLLIDYIYTGQIPINSDNVMSVLSGADYLQLDEVKRLCFDFMEKELTAENCFIMLNMADFYGDDLMKSKVYKYISDNLEIFIKTENFKNLSEDDLIQIVLTPNHYQTKQTAKFKSVLEWTTHDKESRSNKLVNFLKLFDLSQLPLTDLKSAIYDDLFQDNNIFMKMINDQKMHLSKANKSFKTKTKVLSIGGIENKIKVIKLQGLIHLPVVTYPNLPTGFQAKSSLKVNNYIYCIGGNSESGTFKEVVRLNLNEEVLKWTQVTSMNDERVSFGAAVFNDVLVVAGGNGENNDAIGLTEIYAIGSNKWKTIASLKHKRQGNQLLVCDGSLFALGGHQGSTCLSSVERLDDMDDKWCDVASMHEARTRFAAVSYGGYIYVMGGLNNRNACIKTVEKYDPRLNSWTYISDMNIARCDHCACIFDDQIVVIGGFLVSKEVKKNIEYFVPTHDKWYMKKETEKSLLMQHSLVVV